MGWLDSSPHGDSAEFSRELRKLRAEAEALPPVFSVISTTATKKVVGITQFFFDEAAWAVSSQTRLCIIRETPVARGKALAPLYYFEGGTHLNGERAAAVWSRFGLDKIG
jgi:hypothetical protein